MENKHEKTPLFTALKNYALNDTLVPFDVPGHKMGKFQTEFKDVVGEMALKMDVNSSKEVDNLGSPKGVILEAERLIADAYGIDHAFMLVNGTSTGVMAMVMSVCNPNDKIIMLRNAHKSAINGLILCGAVPVFMEPDIDEEWGIAHNISFEMIEKAINENPDAKAILLNNPTYFGVATDIEKVVKLAHEKGIAVLVDEAHGAHLHFNDRLPRSGSSCGVDMAATSIHKTGGSLTQSSVLLVNNGLVKHYDVKTVLNMLQTTSANYLLMSSIDVARKKLALEGKQIFDRLIDLCIDAKDQINQIPGIQVMMSDYIESRGTFKLDETKLVIKVNDLGLTGFEVYEMLKEDYNIQMELAETYVVMAVISVGDNEDSIQALITALKDISKRFYGTKPKFEVESLALSTPVMKLSPRDAFFSKNTPIKLEDAVGKISGDSIMIYPPGIPLVIPGEVVSEEMIEHLKFYLTQNTLLLNDCDDDYTIKVVRES